MSEIIDKNNERIIRFFKSLDHLLDGVEQLAFNCKPSLNGEHFLTDREVAEKLKVSRRTLQDYRTEGRISFIHLGGKILYRESDIEKMLEKAYCRAWE